MYVETGEEADDIFVSTRRARRAHLVDRSWMARHVGRMRFG